ncbi:hypothetical protein [Azospirillum argentinense]|uniref:hypothetical protein n=1 Tax=Azospirillum argentinense TaxID=2970906 RepID=UPI0032DF328A
MLAIEQNALDAIRVGIEDYRLAQAENLDARYKSALRNVYTGMLLLAKTKLYMLSKAGTSGELIRIHKVKLIDGAIQAEPVPNRTVDFGDIMERFKHLKLDLPWKKFEEIQRIRNDAEHYHCDGREKQVQQALADAADIIRQLLALLEMTPVTALGAENWKTLLDNQTVHEEMMAVCQATFSNIVWFSNSARASQAEFRCPACGSGLIKHVGSPDASQGDLELECQACGDACDPDEVVSKAVESLYFAESYLAATKGGEPPTSICPECSHDTYVYEDGKCANCGFESSGGADAFCHVCHQPLTVEEQHEHPGICSYHQNALSKEDEVF